MYDVLIIGGGVSGTAIARELSRYAVKTALLEKHPDVAMGATKANSAIVHGGFAEAHSKVKGRLCYKGRKRFAALSEELGFPFKPIGSFVLAFDAKQLPELEALLANGRENGLPDLKIMNRDEIIAREPNINPDVQYGLWCDGAGICSPYEYCIAMAENAVANGVELFLDGRVTGLAKKDGGFTVTTADGRTFDSRFVVNASGLQAAEISALAGVDDFGIRPRSGEYLLMNQGTGVLVNSVLFQMPTKMGKGILVTPTVYGNLLIGPDAINEERDDRDTHVERLHHIYQQALLTTPGLDIKKYLRSFAGVRAVSTTDDFIIEHTRVPGFVNAAGIQSPGMTSSPAIAEMVRDILADAGLRLKEKPDFNPRRRAVYQQRELIAAKDLKPLLDLQLGAEGRVVCRCEQIPEAMIRDAFSREVPVATIDGVKRRARAGMGFCQGAFCRPRVAELAKSLGLTLDTRTDVERDGLKRVGREEILAYFQEHGASR